MLCCGRDATSLFHVGQFSLSFISLSLCQVPDVFKKERKRSSTTQPTPLQNNDDNDLSILPHDTKTSFFDNSWESVEPNTLPITTTDILLKSSSSGLNESVSELPSQLPIKSYYQGSDFVILKGSVCQIV